ncbi:MAG: hypothetical protein WCE53_04745 [Candidatus Acidiferrum sp.]
MSVVALVIALFGEHMARLCFHPELHLDAAVRKPDSLKVPRYLKVGDAVVRPIGDSYFFRLAVTNTGNAAAKEVQVVLAKVERMVGDKPSQVDRFTPMNLKWTHTGSTTRNTLMPDLPRVFCDFIHIGDPKTRVDCGEDLDGVAPDDAVLCLDVEATSGNKENLLAPGTYRFDLRLVAENSRARSYTVEAWFPGKWFPEENEMFDKGFKMRKP